MYMLVCSEVKAIGESCYRGISLNSAAPERVWLQQKSGVGLLGISKWWDGSRIKILRVSKSLTASHQRTASMAVWHSFWESVRLSTSTRRCAKDGPSEALSVMACVWASDASVWFWNLSLIFTAKTICPESYQRKTGNICKVLKCESSSCVRGLAWTCAGRSLHKAEENTLVST